MAQPGARVVMRAAGTALILDVTYGRLPSVLHWGADPGSATGADLDALARSGTAPIAPNAVDVAPSLSILPEAWTGWLGTPGVTGSRAGTAWSPRFRTTRIVVDGRAVGAREPGDGVATVTARELVVEATDATAALTLELTVVLDDSGVFRARAQLTNTGDGVYQLDGLVLAFPVPQLASELLDFAGRWGKERVPQRRPITVGAHRREGRRGRTGADAATVLHAGTPGFGFAEGEVWGVHTAWSGNHLHYLERVPDGTQVLGGGELLLPGEVRLTSGQSYRSPWVYGVHGHGLDDVARRFHRMLRARPQHPVSPRPVTLNVWEAVYFDHDLPTLLELAELAAELGVERYVLDDGWFGARRDDRAGLGDWTVSPEVWPDGLHPLVRRVTELGMQFGLWVEPEMVNPDSDLARAHPEWIMATGGRRPVESRHQQVLNLGIPECYAHIRDALVALLDEYDIAYLKWDHNRDLVDAGTQPEGRPGVHEQTLAFYRLVDELKARYPGLEIESCSSGGSRVDLEVLQRTDRIWVSDNIDPLDRQQLLPWTAQLVPPELLGSHIASGVSHTTGRRHALSFRAATALFGHLGIEWDLRQATPEERRQLRDWIGFYKEWRHLLHGGDLVRLDVPDPTLSAHGVVALDGSAGIYSLASLAMSTVVSPGRVRVPGLHPQRRYRVRPVFPADLSSLVRPPEWWNDGDGVVMTGALLGLAGLQAPILPPEHAVVYLATAE
ncbi:alpha-galactosidase [Gryllotalpicola ginsengisoli]|uniref:alpha-galactosidase n=1 Tax=Gryllotalpicola ginsengisoli TaxID=444608 RepID=UPI0003B4F0FF|nr:alpha-galactosidase [Gryllotalpicola ginsengisoli]